MSGPRTLRGFTLIEMLAVIAMFGLIAAMALPNINLGSSRIVQGEAQDLASTIEFARQRAVMTGRTHQVVIEVERGEHWVEWDGPPDAATEEAAYAGDGAGERPLDLVPPSLDTGGAFVPIPGALGRVHTVDPDVMILGVVLGESLMDQGRIELRMTPDGTAERASVLVGDTEGAHALLVQVEPLADAVRVIDAK